MNIGIGLKCPNGHFKVQVMVGEPKCPICGSKLVQDKEAPDTAMNRKSKHCGTAIALNVTDTGHCPICGQLWDSD